MQVDFLLLSVGYMTREVKSLTGGGEVRGIGSESGLLDQFRFINHNLFFWSFLIFPSTLLFPRHHLCQLNWLRPGVVWCPLMLQWSRTLTHSCCDRTCLYIRIQRCLKKDLKAAFNWNPFKFLYLFTIFHQGFYLNILRPWAESLFFFFVFNSCLTHLESNLLLLSCSIWMYWCAQKTHTNLLLPTFYTHSDSVAVQSSRKPLASDPQRRNTDQNQAGVGPVALSDLQSMAREEGEGMETTETESFSPAPTSLPSLEQLLTSPEPKQGVFESRGPQKKKSTFSLQKDCIDDLFNKI